jgi:hypothetical protein
MKRALRFGTLMAVLVFTAWAGSDKPAFAIEYCEYQHGTPCYVPKASVECINSDGSIGGCFCAKDLTTGGYSWVCTL